MDFEKKAKHYRDLIELIRNFVTQIKKDTDFYEICPITEEDFNKEHLLEIISYYEFVISTYKKFFNRILMTCDEKKLDHMIVLIYNFSEYNRTRKRYKKKKKVKKKKKPQEVKNEKES